MSNTKNSLIIGGAVAFLILVGLAWSYTEAIKAKNDIERAKIESSERLKAEEMRREQVEADREQEQNNKEFAAKRKADCLKIYETESDKWGNVRGWRYDDDEEACYIRYRDPSPKTDSECDKNHPLKSEDGETSYFWNVRDNLMCKEGEFENSF